MKIIERVVPRRRFASPIKYRNEDCIFHIVRVFPWFAHSMHLCTFEFSINAQKSAVFYTLVIRNLGDNGTLSRIKRH